MRSVETDMRLIPNKTRMIAKAVNLVYSLSTGQLSILNSMNSERTVLHARIDP